MFFERDVEYYAINRDLDEIAGGSLQLYASWDDAVPMARRELIDADVAIVTSYCPDALDAERLLLDAARPLRVFYDLDTPVTLSRLSEGHRPAYVGQRGFADYDLVFSYTGGTALADLRLHLGAVRVAPLYGHVDPAVHRPVPPSARFQSALTYLGTYAADRQSTLQDLFIEPARQAPNLRFTIGGAQYPSDFPWTPNIFFVRHLPPPEHPTFYCSGRLTLNVTRQAMADMGWCPSGRLFEAAACGAAILSDCWDGLEQFFTPGRDILVAATAADTLAALHLDDAEIGRIAAAGRERVLAEHTSDHRAAEFERALDAIVRPAVSICEEA